uniref:CG3509 protein n=1 Tax=Drosophila melanogaster TaxID=7227 RepID=A0APB0_DROME|nr:CG3509 [Drosophila melanogaster]CAL26444.1 CG3509 [Drosophila melanogaster]CAL26445.1 CG3509 [Drosophila melanogaster]
MKLKPVERNDGSDDESEEEMPNDHPESEDSNMGEEEELPEEDEEEMEEDEEEDRQDGDEVETDNLGADRNPYPTPPPDDGSKLVPPDSDNPKSMVPKPKGTLISLALMAIGKLASRSGSSVQAIMTYLKDNGQEWKDPKKTARLLHRALKLAEANGEVVMVKRSFKLTDKHKNSSKAVEKMKAKKQKEKEKKAKVEKVLKEKIQKKEAKAKMKEKKASKEKSSKPTERKTKQAVKKKKPEDGTKDNPPASKAASSAAAQAMLETSQTAIPEAGKKPAKTKVKLQADSSEAGKTKKPRKSIGTLAQPKAARPKVKAVKKLVAGKGASTPDLSIMEAQATSTPQGATKAKRKRKV